MRCFAFAPEQVRLTKPLKAAQPRQKSLAVWVAPIAQVLFEAKRALPPSTSHSAIFVRHAAHKDAVVEKVRFVAVCYSAEACYLVGVRTGASSAH